MKRVESFNQIQGLTANPANTMLHVTYMLVVISHSTM